MLREKVNILMSYFGFVGIWIEIKLINKTRKYICTKETKNYSILTMFILGSYIRHKLFVVITVITFFSYFNTKIGINWFNTKSSEFKFNTGSVLHNVSYIFTYV